MLTLIIICYGLWSQLQVISHLQLIIVMQLKYAGSRNKRLGK